MKKSLIIAVIAFVLGLSAPVNAAEDVLIVNLQYVVSQSKSGVSLRKQSEGLNKEVIELRDEVSNDLQAKGKKLEEDKTLLAPEVFQERLNSLQTEAESKQQELQTKVQKIQEAIQRASASIDSVMSPILTEIVNEKGAKILTGGKRKGNKGYFFEPTVMTNVSQDSRIMYLTNTFFSP